MGIAMFVGARSMCFRLLGRIVCLRFDCSGGFLRGVRRFCRLGMYWLLVGKGVWLVVSWDRWRGLRRGAF